ncbi:hypothetical protein [Methanobacterium sp. 42_16]|uniref:hypothetical protein n=1 Tax=Methanobacterium sp. 42_16 TaxID=1641383 RepID=UPI000745F90F|nr:hypothetical protein [Methanobacterium sp. 42_16]KUK71621.1 MAG: Uncharacterized protein XD90_2211 [Methanobacterium sp. 42_16]
MIMNFLTSQQKRVLNGIKYFHAEYQGGIPYKILKLDLDMSEEDLNPILEHLEKENYISRREGFIYLEKDRKSKENEAAIHQETPLGESSKETVEDNARDVSSTEKGKVNETFDAVKDVDNAPKEVTPAPTSTEDVTPSDTPVEVSNESGMDSVTSDVPLEEEGAKGEEESKETDELEDRFSEKELESMELIQKLVDESGKISRTLLEGNLLYGEMELTDIRMYNLITSLENKGVLRKFTLTDGEYYKFTP